MMQRKRSAAMTPLFDCKVGVGLLDLSYDIPLGTPGVDIQEHRQRVMHFTPSVDLPGSESVNVQRLLLPIATDSNIPARLYRQSKARSTRVHGDMPTLFFFGGNAFTAHEVKFTDMFLNFVVHITGCQAVAIQTRLAPESKFPAGLNDAELAIDYMLNNHRMFHIDRSCVIFTGYSAGGNIAALLGAKAVERNWAIAYQMLVGPVTDFSRSIKSSRQTQNQDKILTEAFVEWMIGLYLPHDLNRKDPSVSPLYIDDLSVMPCTDIVVGEFDRFGGDGRAFADKMQSQCPHKLLSLWDVPREDHGLFWQNKSAIIAIARRIQSTLNHLGPQSPSKTLRSGVQIIELGDRNGQTNSRLLIDKKSNKAHLEDYDVSDTDKDSDTAKKPKFTS